MLAVGLMWIGIMGKKGEWPNNFRCEYESRKV